MVAWWGLDTAGGKPWDSPSGHTSPALHPHHSKSSSIHECVCPPAAASASWASAWRFWPSPLSLTPQHSGKNSRSKHPWNNDIKKNQKQDGSRNNRLISRARSPYRRLHSEEPGAVVRAAVTGRPPVAHTVQVVVERQLCVCENISPHVGCSACC